MDIKIGEDTFNKKPNILEEIAYRDTWGKGADSFIAMIYERLVLMRDLLAEDGSIYVHCDWRVNSYIRLVMDEVFGRENFQNEIVWNYDGPQSPSKTKFATKYDKIIWYSKSKNIFVSIPDLYAGTPLSDEQLKQYKQDEHGRWFYDLPKGSYTDASIERLAKEGRIRYTKSGKTRIKYYLRVGDKGQIIRDKKISDVWTDIPSLGNVNSKQKTKYPTQKPEGLLERIIKASSNEGDLVADFFCGSGTTAAVAEKLGRKWICADLGKFAIHTTRKRMLGVQRELKAEHKNYRAFEILNLGKYERQHYIGVNPNLSAEQQGQQIAAKSKQYLSLILRAYAAQPIEQSMVFHGQKAGRMSAIGPINLPVTSLFVDEIILECRTTHITRVDILAFEFEMNLFARICDDAKARGIDIAAKYIPTDVFDKRAVEKNQVVFHNVAFVEVEPRITTRNSQTAEVEERWTGNYIFENEWQSFRTKKDRAIELISTAHECAPGKRKIAVTVVDIFSNDTMRILAINL